VATLASARPDRGVPLRTASICPQWKRGQSSRWVNQFVPYRIDLVAMRHTPDRCNTASAAGNSNEVRPLIVNADQAHDAEMTSQELTRCPHCRKLDADFIRQERRARSVVFHYRCRACETMWSVKAARIRNHADNVIPFPGPTPDPENGDSGSSPDG
jgi:hypothetical protein